MPRIQKLHHACSEYHAKCAEDWAVPAACCAASADIQGHCRQASSDGCQTWIKFDDSQCDLYKLLGFPPIDLTSVGWMMRATQLMRRRDHWPRGNSWSCTAVGTMLLSTTNVCRTLLGAMVVIGNIRQGHRRRGHQGAEGGAVDGAGQVARPAHRRQLV